MGVIINRKKTLKAIDKATQFTGKGGRRMTDAFVIEAWGPSLQGKLKSELKCLSGG